jgi:hypothetical protein
MVQDHKTEAACLVEQGAQYERRVGLTPAGDGTDPVFAGFKKGGFSLFFGDSPFYHFDLDGRWQRAVVQGTHFVKGLDGRVQVIHRVRQERNLVLDRDLLDDVETSEFDRRVQAAALGIIADLEAGRLARIEPPARATPLSDDELHRFLERIVGWDADAWALDRERYLAAYGSRELGFLPPECQNAVVVQATLHDAAGVAFGGPERGPVHVRCLGEFQRHAARVAALWGRRLTQGRTLFLAGAGVLRQPIEAVAGYLDVIQGIFPIVSRPAGLPVEGLAEDGSSAKLGVHALLDDFLPPLPDCPGLRELANRGLARVSLLVESGDHKTRALYGKGYSGQDLAAAIQNLKSARIGISLLTLVGAGGVERAVSHRLETGGLFESLALGSGDFVFLLDENEIGGARRLGEAITPLDCPAWRAEQARLKDVLAPLKKRGVKVLGYTFEKQRP